MPTGIASGSPTNPGTTCQYSKAKNNIMGKYRALIIEDDASMRKMYSQLLKSEFEGITARNGLDALNLLEHVEPDILLVDGVMPVMDGWEFTSELRKIPDYRDVITIFISAKGGIDAIKDGYEKGVDLYMVKPIEPDRLIRVIRDKITEKGLLPKTKKHTIGDLRDLVKEGWQDTAGSQLQAQPPLQQTEEIPG
jgi:CheY-like chemotaxis protein